MHWRACLLTFLCLPAIGSDAVEPVPLRSQGFERRSAELQGTWHVADAEHEGQPLSQLVGGQLTISQDSFHLHTATGQDFSGQVILLPASSPPALDLAHQAGALAGRRWLTIYVLDGDQLTLCYVDALGNSPRPKRFRTPASSKATIVILKRKALAQARD
jgi:uncharacterized protein (TIGR03067 family)